MDFCTGDTGVAKKIFESAAIFRFQSIPRRPSAHRVSVCSLLYLSHMGAEGTINKENPSWPDRGSRKQSNRQEEDNGQRRKCNDDDRPI